MKIPRLYINIDLRFNIMQYITYAIVTNDGDIFTMNKTDFPMLAISHLTIVDHYGINPDSIFDTGWIFPDGTEQWRFIDN